MSDEHDNEFTDPSYLGEEDGRDGADNSEVGSASDEMLERRQNGYLPMRPPVYRRLWKLRNNGYPVLAPLPTQSKVNTKKKKGRGLKTPRLMLPIWLG